MARRLLSRSDGTREFRPLFAAQGNGPGASIWCQFLDLAPPESAEFWVALDGDTPVGRIGANPMPSYPGKGAIGFFEAQDFGIASQLLGTAEAWLAERGVKQAIGPMNLNTWFPYRFRVDENELSFRWEPNHPREYPTYFEQAGYHAAESYHTPAADGLAGYAERVRPAWEKLQREGFHFRRFENQDFLEREVPILHELNLAGFKENAFFEPIPLDYFKALYAPLVGKMDNRYSYFALSPEGKEIGFFYIFVDQGYLIFKTIVVLPAFRGNGISTALTYLPASEAVARGITKFATALIHNGNHSESYTRKGEALWTHSYQLYAKGLSHA